MEDIMGSKLFQKLYDRIEINSLSNSAARDIQNKEVRESVERNVIFNNATDNYVNLVNFMPNNK